MCLKIYAWLTVNILSPVLVRNLGMINWLDLFSLEENVFFFLLRLMSSTSLIFAFVKSFILFFLCVLKN